MIDNRWKLTKNSICHLSDWAINAIVSTGYCYHTKPFTTSCQTPTDRYMNIKSIARSRKRINNQAVIASHRFKVKGVSACHQ